MNVQTSRTRTRAGHAEELTHPKFSRKTLSISIDVSECDRARHEHAAPPRDLASPLAPIVVNGMVFAAASGEFRGAGQLTAAQRAQRSTPAILYALDGATGKMLWSSGRTITSFARGGLSAGSGQVYLVTYDNTLYAFGIPMEH
jgi:outer membrane protein assembly factor BamB